MSVNASDFCQVACRVHSATTSPCSQPAVQYRHSSSFANRSTLVVVMSLRDNIGDAADGVWLQSNPVLPMFAYNITNDVSLHVGSQNTKINHLSKDCKHFKFIFKCPFFLFQMFKVRERLVKCEVFITDISVFLQIVHRFNFYFPPCKYKPKPISTCRQPRIRI